eukprot:CAMPEP_0180264684 /NCGR_PEP_ID=MMETSP0987-20121128/45939_1 /TAXON_ID=697907 /ORGANISM="non described non described, Strain CCMP2293" /LENGTH=402 /DNA_ID=CAMNT_0022234983 /DNA_START=29 /DNA_END=1235 /DNA_ORIENTATION=-
MPFGHHRSHGQPFPAPPLAPASTNAASRWEQLTRLGVSDASLLRAPYAVGTALTSSPEAEPDLASRSEPMDFFDSMAGSFELENAVAASPAGSAPAARGAQDWRTVPLRSPEPTTFPTCASACMALQQKRAACLREVLSAVATYADQHISAWNSDAAPHGFGGAAGDEEMGEFESGEDMDRPPLVQQLLCNFIELAASSKGEAAVKALGTVGALLAAQKPLVLVTERAEWLSRLLEWLGDFIATDGNDAAFPAEGASHVRGVAAGAMLDLGVCSGSLRCILSTVTALLSQTNIDASSLGGNTSEASQTALDSTERPAPVGVLLPALSSQSRRGQHQVSPGAAAGVSKRAVQRPRVERERSLAGERPVRLGGTDGEYLYIHTSAGLAKYGTGYGGTIAGREYV